MMCRFLSADFELSVQCPIDKIQRTVRFQAYPQLCVHILDVVACSAKPRVADLTCGNACRGLLENSEFWDKIYPEAALYSHGQ